jgi:SAM-dependent methyltransferase
MTDSDENIKNLLADEQINSLKLIDITETLVEKVKNLDAETEKMMIDYLADEALQEFCRINQYFSFNSESVNELKDIYNLLNQNIRHLDDQAAQSELDAVGQEHYVNLCNWLVRTNAFAGKIYSSEQEQTQAVACSEYTPDLQLKILHIDKNNLLGPVLDVGCGREMNLMNYLRDQGIEAYGIDRFMIDNPYYLKSDWLEHDFESEKWGTIISNLGFSNHFIHHNLRADGNYREYAKKYMEIIHSLKPGGSFYYAPDLPFIEEHLDRNKFQYSGFPIEGYEFKSSRITRIS